MKIFSLRKLGNIRRPKMLKSVSEKDEDNFQKIEGIKKIQLIFLNIRCSTQIF